MRKVIRYEYATGAVGGHSENDMGAEGWEGYAVEDRIHYYKRPVMDDPVEPEVTDEPTEEEAEAPAPRRRGRPAKVAV